MVALCLLMASVVCLPASALLHVELVRQRLVVLLPFPAASVDICWSATKPLKRDSSLLHWCEVGVVWLTDHGRRWSASSKPSWPTNTRLLLARVGKRDNKALAGQLGGWWDRLMRAREGRKKDERKEMSTPTAAKKAQPAS